MSLTPLLGGKLHWAEGASSPSEDAFWLAAAVPTLSANTPVLDMACGNGAVGLSLLVRQPALMLTGLDCDEAILTEAKVNAASNQRSVVWQQADALTTTYPTPYSVVLCNPPFHARAKGHDSPSARKALAHGLDDIGGWVKAWYAALADEGKLFTIVHAQLEAEIIRAIQPSGGTVWFAPLATHPTRAAKRLLVCWHKSGEPFAMRTLPVVPSYHSPLRHAVLHEALALAVFSPC
jgi:tRNA1(Val) A37 N6-methylase TrmN6